MEETEDDPVGPTNRQTGRLRDSSWVELAPSSV